MKFIYEEPKEGILTLGVVFHVIRSREIQELTGYEPLGYVIEDETGAREARPDKKRLIQLLIHSAFLGDPYAEHEAKKCDECQEIDKVFDIIAEEELADIKEKFFGKRDAKRLREWPRKGGVL